MTRVCIDIANAREALAWIDRAIAAGLVPDDAGVRSEDAVFYAGSVQESTVLVIDRHAGPGPWLRPPSPTPSF